MSGGGGGRRWVRAGDEGFWIERGGGRCCAGFVLVKKVPGTLHFLAKSPGHSFDFMSMNLTHFVHQWYFGNKPSPRRRAVTTRFHPTHPSLHPVTSPVPPCLVPDVLS